VKKEVDQVIDIERISFPLRAQRKYPEQTKKKVVQLVKSLGVRKVATSVNIPETSVGYWVKDGTGRAPGSGRKPQLLEIEKELLEYFVECRKNGIQVTNCSLVKEARAIADRKLIPNIIETQLAVGF